MHKTIHPRSVRARRIRGATLLEALIGFAVAAAGLLALVRSQVHFDYAADVARQRGIAVRLAEADQETLRSFDQVGDAGVATDFDALGAALVDGIAVPDANTLYRLQRQVTPATDGRHRVVAIQVDWPDRQGHTQRIVLRDLIARAAPALSAALAIQAPPGMRAPLAGRHTTIPVRARDLGDGRSVFKPVEAGAVAWVFDNASGEITSTCTVPVDRPAARLSAADLAGACTTVRGQLLTGTVQFNLRGATHRLADGRWLVKPVHPGSAVWLLSGGPPARISGVCSVPPDVPADALTVPHLSSCSSVDQAVHPFDPAHPHDPPTTADAEAPRWPALALQVRLTLLSTGHPDAPTCLADAPSTARAAALVWQVEYACLIPMNGEGRWQGRSTIVAQPYADAGPASWTIAATAGAFRVCRYAPSDAADLMDAEHPPEYGRRRGACPDGRSDCTGVSGNLGHQNFLVLEGTQACPADGPPDPSAGDFVNSHTAAHQP